MPGNSASRLFPSPLALSGWAGKRLPVAFENGGTSHLLRIHTLNHRYNCNALQLYPWFSVCSEFANLYIWISQPQSPPTIPQTPSWVCVTVYSTSSARWGWTYHTNSPCKHATMCRHRAVIEPMMAIVCFITVQLSLDLHHWSSWQNCHSFFQTGSDSHMVQILYVVYTIILFL